MKDGPDEYPFRIHQQFISDQTKQKNIQNNSQKNNSSKQIAAVIPSRPFRTFDEQWRPAPERARIDLEMDLTLLYAPAPLSLPSAPLCPSTQAPPMPLFDMTPDDWTLLGIVLVLLALPGTIKTTARGIDRLLGRGETPPEPKR